MVVSQVELGAVIEDRGKCVNQFLDEVGAATAAGLRRYWLGDRGTWDALGLLGVAAVQNPAISVGTSVTRTYARHPLALAGHALTTQAISGGRLTLGVGPSHRAIIEQQYGYRFDRPGRHTREYLSCLIPLLRGESVRYGGEQVSVHGQVMAPGAAPPPVLLAALGPAMLRLAAELTEGTVAMWAGPRVLEDHLVPTLAKHSSALGRAHAPRVVVQVPVCVTGDSDDARGRLLDTYAAAGRMPSYRRVLDREGVETIADVAMIGTEQHVDDSLRRIEDAGATGFVAVPFGDGPEHRRTIEFLGGRDSA
jgi:F420-dependent oxidoreductase-like protein